MLSESPETAQSSLLESTDNTSTPKRSSKLKWGLASLAIVGGTALAAHFAGFNLATMAAGMFSSGTWLSSALTAVGTLGSVWASAAMVAGGLLSVAVSVAVIGLSAVLLKAAFSFISDKTVRRQPEEPKLAVKADDVVEELTPAATTAGDSGQTPVLNAADSDHEKEAGHSAADQAVYDTQHATVPQQPEPEPEPTGYARSGCE